MSASKKPAPNSKKTENHDAKVFAKCYHEGRKAFDIQRDKCPYKSDGSGKRMSWFDGYLDARSEEMLKRTHQRLTLALERNASEADDDERRLTKSISGRRHESASP